MVISDVYRSFNRNETPWEFWNPQSMTVPVNFHRSWPWQIILIFNTVILTLYIKNNAWVTVNNDFFVTSEAIRQWFSRVTKSRVKIIAESPHEWQKIVIHGNECIILFLTRYFMSWTHKSAKNYHRALISPLLPRAGFSDRALWRHNNWSVTSCEREILVLWRHICLLSLHAQFGAKAIFTSE